MFYYLCFAIAGYMFGSVLFAPLFGRIFKKGDIVARSKDRNPGTANAFMQGGLLCGALTLVCDLGKGFLPVFLCLRLQEDRPALELGLAIVIAAPVLGHIFPLYHHFRGGKGIAVTFGSLLGFVPDLSAALTLAFFFILFSLVIRITPHFYRTIGTYLFTMVTFLIWSDILALRAGFLVITVLVCIRMHLSSEEKEKCKVRLLWMH